MRLLGLWLREGEAGVAAVACEDPYTMAAARRKLRPKRRKVRSHRLVRHENARETIFELIDVIESVGDGVLHVTNWEGAFGGEDIAVRIYDLNYLRESVVEHPATQVWWMPVSFRNELMIRAPDTWSVVRLGFALKSEEEVVDLPPRIAEIVRNELDLSPGVPITKRVLAHVRTFTAPYAPLTSSDLGSLHKFPDLREVNLWGEQAVDLAQLAGIRGVDTVRISAAMTIDYASLRTVPSLRSLSIRGPDSDSSGLHWLVNLQALRLVHTNCKEIPSLQALRHLTDLTVVAAPVTDASPIAYLTSLIHLNLSGTQVSDLQPLSQLTRLKTLWLSHTNVSKLSPLAGLADLEDLDVSFTETADLTPLSGLSALRALDLSGTPAATQPLDWLREALPECRIDT